MKSVTVEDLSQVSADDLARALNDRLTQEGNPFWPNEVFKLFAAHGVLPCVDAFMARIRNGGCEIGFILRNTGFYKGRWWDVGGRVNQGESYSEAITRHVRETLGDKVKFHLVPGQNWNKPAFVAQYGPREFILAEEESAGHEPSKFCTSPTWIIELENEDFEFVTTNYGGQEAAEVRFFPLDKLPYGDELGYGGDATVYAVAEYVRDNM